MAQIEQNIIPKILIVSWYQGTLQTITAFQWRIHHGGAEGTCLPRFQAKGGSHAKVPSLFWHNNAETGFTSQSLGLPAYACKTDSSTAIKLLAPRMHQNLPFWAHKSKTFLEGGIATPKGSETPLPHTPPLGAFGALLLARAMIRPPLFKPWIRPCCILYSLRATWRNY